jgi:hypothetical protein
MTTITAFDGCPSRLRVPFRDKERLPRAHRAIDAAFIVVSHPKSHGLRRLRPGHRVVEAKTPLERALLDVPTVEAHDLLEKLILNVARSPTELKFRSLKASNAKIKREIIDVPEVLQVMTLLGWVSETVEGEGDGLSLPANVTLLDARGARG